MGANGGFTQEDLYHYGIIGLLDAKKKYNPDKGVPFEAYASIRINGEIISALRKNPLIRLPQEKRGLVKQVNKAKKELEDQGNQPTPEAICEKLGWDIGRVYEVQTLSSHVVSVDDDVKGGNIIQLRSHLKNHGQPENQILNKDLAKIIQYCLEMISDDTQRFVFVARDLEKMTLKEVGNKLDVSVETVRLKQKAAKKSMRSCLETHDWDLQ